MKNRKVSKKMSVVTHGAVHAAAILLVLLVMVIINVLASSSSQQLMKTIGRDNIELKRLEESLERETSRWDEMRTPERIESMLIRHALSMKPPRADQNVYMQANGRPYARQLSVARAQRAADPVAMNRKQGRATRARR